VKRLTFLLLLATSSARAEGADTAAEGADATVAARVEEPNAAEDAGATVAARVEGRSAAEGAEDEASDPTANALYLYPYALLKRGVVLGYERAFGSFPITLTTRFSLDARAREDFRSTAFGVGVGARWYALGKGPFSDWSGDAPVGLFLGARASLRFSFLRTREGDQVGRATRATAALQLGVRFVGWGVLEVTPYVEGSFHTDFVGHLAPQLRPTGSFGWTLGALF